MMIKKLTASFGKLNGDTLELKEGLNVICAPNESGKSTWCAFVRAMLYGIDSAERQKAGYLPDKLRYAPWSGAPMQGEMVVSADSRDITLTRWTRLKNAPMREFTAVYSGTNVEVSGMTASNVGEMLTGTSKEVFRRSAFIEQGSIAVSGSPELEKRINSIVSTGEEDCSFTEVDEQLRSWQRKRRYNRRGKLPELEERMADARSRISEIEYTASERLRLTENLETGKAECKQLEADVIESRKNARKAALENLQRLRRELSLANEDYERAVSERDACKEALSECEMGERKPEDVRAEVEADIGKCAELRETAARKSSPVLAIVMLVLALAAAAAACLIPLYYLFIGTAAFAALGVYFFIKYKNVTNAALNAAKELLNIFGKYNAEDEDGILQKEAEYLELYNQYEKSETREHRTAIMLSAARKDQERIEAETLANLDFMSGDSEAARLSRELLAAQQRCESTSARLSELKGKLDSMGDPVVLGSELKTMEEEYAAIKSEYEAIDLAVETMRAADDDIQSRFSPELGKAAAEYMSMVTGGRYDTLLINRDFSAKTKAEGDSIAHETEYLSAGTLDLMYIAVRLAVCKLALPEEANCPLIIDDAFVNLDAERTAQTMKLLREIAKERQVILFTCKELQ